MFVKASKLAPWRIGEAYGRSPKGCNSLPCHQAKGPIRCSPPSRHQDPGDHRSSWLHQRRSYLIIVTDPHQSTKRQVNSGRSVNWTYPKTQESWRVHCGEWSHSPTHVSHIGYYWWVRLPLPWFCQHTGWRESEPPRYIDRLCFSRCISYPCSTVSPIQRQLPCQSH